MADFDTDHPVTTMINLRGKLYPGMGIILGGPLANIILEEEDMFRNSKYVDVTASRAVGVDYTNDTGKSIMVHVCFDDTDNGSPWINIHVDGVMIISDNFDKGSSRVTATYSFIVPPGSVYVVHNPGSWARVTKWTELRPV